jgi:dipeptidyl aminopeptidase/acylaminoacyl peptidase
MKKLFLLLALSMFACGVPQIFVTPVPTFDPNSIGTFIAETANAASTQTQIFITPSSTPTLTPTSTPTAIFTATPTATDTAAPTPTLTAYGKYTIEYLRSRTYGGGDIKLLKTVRREKNFTTYLARYASDGLAMHALINIPNDAKTHPVIIIIHGYADPKEYTLLEENRYMDNAIARQGFITIHPAMRNYPPSDKGDNLFRVGQTIDILNLIAIIKAQSGQPGLLENVKPGHIGIEGSSTGGGVALRVLTVNADVKAAFLYSAISGDERRNVPLFHRFAHDPQFAGEPAVPENILAGISPSSYYEDITAPVLLAHGIDDRVVPLEWGQETCAQLKNANVNVTCNFYGKAGHSFSGANLEKLISRAVEFYRMYLN